MRWIEISVVTIAASFTSGQTGASTYDLSQVEGIGHFQGSAAARETLSRLGFVVVPAELKQVFEAYVHNPLPPFVTEDSAWHTYHVILEEGVRQLEAGQARRLLGFSRRLTAAAWTAAGGNAASPEADLARFAAVGCLLQEPGGREVPAALRAEAERCAAFLRQRSGEEKLLFFENPFRAEHFRPAGFYSSDESLAACFRARQWFGTACFVSISTQATPGSAHATTSRSSPPSSRAR